MPDSIYLTKMPTAAPHLPAESDPNYIQHVHCNGARFHVLSYTTDGAKCSERQCIINKPKAVKEK